MCSLHATITILATTVLFACTTTSERAATPKFDEVRVQEWMNAAEDGDAGSQFLAGLACDEGRGVAVDRSQAAKWYGMAADRGHPGALTNLGLLLQHGDGVERSDEEAARLFERAARQDFAAAQHNLGVCFLLGRGVATDRVEARHWLELAADQGHQKASELLAAIDRGAFDHPDDPIARAEAGSAVDQYRLSLNYFRGALVPRDEQLGMHWLRAAADQGLADAQFLYGWKHEQSGDLNEAAHWIALAAGQGLAIAEAQLGLMHESGRGVPRDEASAANWMRRAAARGYAPAQYDMGLMYLKGVGVGISEHDAFRWIRSAAEQGLLAAQSKLASMYENGRGVERDRIAAHRWYGLAAHQGSVSAQADLDRLIRTLEPGEKAEIERTSCTDPRTSAAMISSSDAPNASGAPSIK